MELMIAEEKTSPMRRESRFSRSGRIQRSVTSNILEVISQFSGGDMAAGEDGRMRIVVRKEDLKQVLEAIRNGRSSGRWNTASPAAVSLEQRLNLMRKRQMLRAASQARASSSASWTPALQSIPEEL